MTITKFGHCCLLLEIRDKRILVDPGRFSDQQNSLTGIDIILITHEHADHFHTESVQTILNNNPSATIITNKSVATLLSKLGLSAHILEGTAKATVRDILLQAYDGEHVEIVGTFGLVQNTGYLIEDSFFFAGDAYTVPKESVDILALPVAGPWCKISDAISFAKAVGPRVTFPVHDATLSEVGKMVTYPHCERELQADNISFVVLDSGIATEL